MHGEDDMYMIDNSYRFHFKEVNNAVETETKGKDESSRTARTESKTHGEDETKNASSNEIQSTAAPPKPKRGRKEMDMANVKASGVKRRLKQARPHPGVHSDKNMTVETCLPESEVQQFYQLVLRQ
jgi:hypothetical protein